MPEIYQLPILSSDAATWINSPGRFGTFFTYVGNGCIKAHIGFKKVVHALKTHDKFLMEALKRGRITADDLRDPDNHKGSFIPFYTACIAFT